MIKEVLNKKGVEAITSDKWHVVHSRFTDSQDERPFRRAIDSEHVDRVGCLKAAKVLRAKLAAKAGSAPPAEQDEVLIRPPGFKSLKLAKSRRTKPRRPA